MELGPLPKLDKKTMAVAKQDHGTISTNYNMPLLFLSNPKAIL